MTEILRVLETPPRSTGQVETDYPLLVDWMYKAYQTVKSAVDYINAQADHAGIVQNAADIATLQGRLDGFIADSITLADANTGAAITFGTPQADADYRIEVQPTAFTGVPASGAFIITSKTYTAAGFSFTISSAPGAGTTVSYDWQLIRNT